MDFEWELEEKHYLKEKELNVTIIRTNRDEKKRRRLTFQCNNHPYKKPRNTLEASFLKSKSCGCRLKDYTEEDFIFDIRDKEVSLYGEYKNDTDKTDFICKYGHVFSARPNKIKRGEGCPVCKKRKLREHFLKDENWFKEKLEKANPSLELVSEYQGIKYPVTCRCKICGHETTTCADKFTTLQTGCRFCKLSIRESIIYTYLEEHNISFVPQKCFDDCRYKQLLPFDFYLPNYNICIEYQGEQHYKPVDFSYTPTEESKQLSQKRFELGKKRDAIKKKYCEDNNIFLLEISYKKRNHLIEVLDDFFNNLNRNSNDCNT